MSDSEIAALKAQIRSRPRVADLAQRRADSDARGRAFGVPAGVVVKPVDAGGVKAEWALPADADDRRAVLYLHGGGYVIGSCESHRHLTAEIGRTAGIRVLTIDYRLAPEHPFPAPVEDTVAAYRFLLGQGLAASDIALAGDSAGGGLVVGAMLAIREAGLPLPGAGWCISPWVDMELTGHSYVDRAEADPMVGREGIQDMVRHYMGDADLRAPHASPIHGDLRGLPPLLIQVGASETLLDDSLMLARAAGAADVPVELQIWPEMVHIWHIFYPMLAAGRRAIGSGASFLRSTLKGS